MQGRLLIWSEMLTVLGNSWFFAKFMQVNRYDFFLNFVRMKLRCFLFIFLGVELFTAWGG